MLKPLNKTVWLGLLFIATSLGIIVFLWWLAGLKNTDVAEGWLFLMNAQRPDFFVFHGRGRPLLQIITLWSFRTTPNSYVALNLAFALSFVVRGIMVYLFVKRYTKDTLLAAAVGFLSILFASDNDHMTMRLINLFWIFNWVMMAIWFYNIGLNKQQASMRFLGLFFLSLAALSRETSFPFFFAAPILFFLDNKEPIATRLKGIGLWLILTTIYFLFYIYNVFILGSEHHTELLAPQNLFIVHELIFESLKRYFLFYWVGILKTSYSATIMSLALAIGLLSLLCLLVFARYNSSKTTWRESIRHLGLSLVLGFATILLGLAMYLPSSAIDTGWRVHMIPTIGASLIILAGIRFVLLRLPFSKHLFAFAAAFVIGFASLHAIKQHLGFAEISRNQQYLMAQIVNQAPALEETAQAIFVFDSTERLQARDIFVDDRRITGFSRALYADTNLDAFLCSVPDAEASQLRNPCTFSETTLTAPNGLEYNLDQILIFEVVQPNYQLVLLEEIPQAYLNGVSPTLAYSPHENICEECPVTTGTERLFYSWPFPNELAPISGTFPHEN